MADSAAQEHFLKDGSGNYHTSSKGVQHEMKRRLYVPAVLLIGLLSAQIVATAHVYVSNLDLLQATEALMRNGYLAVPNAKIAARLDSLATALAGGLFFTLSVGAGLSLATLIGAWLWDRAFCRRRRTTVACLLVWLTGLIMINEDGWNLVATAYLVVVPLVTAIAAIQLLPARTTLISPVGVVWPIAAAVILALVWSLVLDRQLFINVRDHLLLSNRAGQSITNAYYEYTLFPAEAFKSLAQKQIRTSVLGAGLDRTAWMRLERTVRTHDYLPMPSGYPADLTIALDSAKDQFFFKQNHETALTLNERELFDNPDRALSTYSRQRDRNRMFRTLTLACLTLGLPLVLFSFLFSALASLPNLFLTVAASDVIAAFLCMIVGTFLLMPVYRGHKAAAVPADLPMALSAPSTLGRIAALRQACDKRRDITAAAIELGLKDSPHIAERYWLARSLAYARDPRARAMLQALVGDPVPIVVCQALWAMGQRKNRTVVPRIVDRIHKSSHWYIQMYAYRTLRTLGWVQPRSPQLSY